ncbi:ammonium transporter [Calderihabitans maritimus]|uniref:Ammonium transporter n=2 Tax=Calderihabitans maritimus TaxID=1246530 RepID=A0A1Z5HQZ9_9FIRM|nr:ammonium transporter [Calderihabitans maritimus]GAW91962.1 ammonium transporter [Calderihabitans maritimus]
MLQRFTSLIVLQALMALVFPALALAAEGPTAESNAVALDTVWTLIAAFLVFFMQAGFAMVEAGFTRAKNAGNIIMKNLMDFSAGSLVYWLIGYGIMFGADKFGLIGTDGFALVVDQGDGMPVWAFIIFQTVFAATAATIVSGAMAERTKFTAYLIYSVVISAIIYPVVGHWIWGGGWLANLGFKDFAGSTVVHSVGGWAALIGAALLGPRIGKYGKDGSVNAIPGHSITLGALGVFILWFGWFGFNPGSTVAGTDLSIALIALNTNLAAAAGATLAMITSWIRYGKPDVSLTLNGALGGLVGITAGCAFVNPLGAVIIGVLSGILIVIAVEIIDKVLKVDDPVGAVAVHAICGAFGTLMVGLLDVEEGLLYSGSAKLLGVQALGVVAVFIWTVVTSYILFKVIKSTIGLRVSEEEEVAGLDRGEHALEAYPDFVARDTSVTL